MSEEVQRMVTELLAQRLGLQASDMAHASGRDQIMAAVVMSLIKRSSSTRNEETGTGTIRRVAAIVGACPRCLGDDGSCVECFGNGSPGYGEPDGAALLEWISGPLSRLGLCVIARSEQPIDHNHVGGSSQ